MFLKLIEFKIKNMCIKRKINLLFNSMVGTDSLQAAYGPHCNSMLPARKIYNLFENRHYV